MLRKMELGMLYIVEPESWEQTEREGASDIDRSAEH